MHNPVRGLGRLLPVAAGTLFLVAACSTGGSTASSDARAASPSAAGGTTQLDGTSWQLSQFTGPGDTEIPMPDAVAPTATFEGGALSGNAGCNQYNATYTLDGSTIKIGPAASTQKACIGPVSAVETAFLGALEAVDTVTVTADSMTLQAGGGSPKLTFSPLEAKSLTDTPWSATGINNGAQAVVSLVAGTDVNAVFTADGQVAGSGGCNAYTGSYTVDGATIKIGPLASTQKLCNTPDGVDTQEQQFLAAMDAATTYAINGDTLELRDDSGALQVSFAAGPAQ